MPRHLVSIADLVMMLRVQAERFDGAARCPNTRELSRTFGLPELVMHPGPINRGVELSSEVADGPCAVILQQVARTVAIGMVVLARAILGESVQQ